MAQEVFRLQVRAENTDWDLPTTNVVPSSPRSRTQRIPRYWRYSFAYLRCLEVESLVNSIPFRHPEFGWLGLRTIMHYQVTSTGAVSIVAAHVRIASNRNSAQHCVDQAACLRAHVIKSEPTNWRSSTEKNYWALFMSTAPPCSLIIMGKGIYDCGCEFEHSQRSVTRCYQKATYSFSTDPGNMPSTVLPAFFWPQNCLLWGERRWRM